MTLTTDDDTAIIRGLSAKVRDLAVSQEKADQLARRVISGLQAEILDNRRHTIAAHVFIEHLQDMLLKVEWVRRTNGTAIVCVWCGATEQDNVHRDDCAWKLAVHMRLDDLE